MTTTRTITQLAAQLFEARGRDLLRYLRQRLRSESDARDIAQEAYLRFIRLGEPQRIENPEAYLFRIASNLLWEHKLRERSLAGQSPLDEEPTVEHTPLETTLSTQIAKRVRLALDRLPVMQRSVVILHLRDGLTYREIGARAGISASMVRKHLNAALLACRRRLRDVEA